jgi:hypothetical protein
MKDQLVSFPSYLQSGIWPYWTPGLMSGAPMLPSLRQDILTGTLPSSVEISSGGVLGALGQERGASLRARSTTSSGAGGGLLGFLTQPANDLRTDPMPRSSMAWEALSAAPLLGSWSDPHADVMATANDDFCKRIRNMCIAQCSDTSLPSGDHEFSFWNCVNKCMQKYGCPSVRA